MSGSKTTLPSLSHMNSDVYETPVPKKSVYEIMENDINIGQLQKKIVLTISLCYFLGATYLFLPSLLYQDPIFMCGDEVCSKQQYVNYDGEKYVDLENSVYSITTEFELYGEKESLKSFGMSISAFGALVGCFYLGKIMDVKGRQFAFRFSWLVVILGGLLEVTAKSTTYIFIATFFVAFGVMGTIVVATVYLSEITSKDFRGKSMSLVFIFFALSQVFIYFECQITTNWRSFLTLFFLVPSTLLYFLVFQIIESPVFLSSKNKIGEAVQIMNYIANYNKQDLTIQETEVKIQEQTKEYGISSLFTYKSLRTLTISNTCLKTAINIVYFGISLSLSLIGGDFVTNILFMGITDVICYISFGYFCSLVKRKLGYISTLFASILCLFLITQIQLPTECQSSKDCIETKYQLGLLIIARFTASISFSLQIVWQNELYPQPVKGTSTGLLNSLAQVGPYSVPYIQQICGSLGVNPLIGICLIPLIIQTPSFFTKETLGMELIQEIEEELEEKLLDSNIELQDLKKCCSTESSCSDDLEARVKSLEVKLLA